MKTVFTTDHDMRSTREHDSATVIDLLRRNTVRHRSRLAYTLLVDGEAERVDLTYEELDRRSRAIGAFLQLAGAAHERVLLLYPQGLEFITAFLGCLYAGAIAIPAYPPRLNRSQARLLNIIDDSGATMALTTRAGLAKAERIFRETSQTRSLRWLVTDEIDSGLEEKWREPEIGGETLAMIQYTSGSTSAPKGVLISHRNLVSNERMIQRAFGQSEKSIIVGWLPLYHDMGLIGNVLQPLFLGARCVLMPPAAFLQRPYRWLRAISDYRATTSGGPNFAYDLCVRKIGQEARDQLDLSSWTVAFNGAEPIFHETLERFAAAFANCGFRREAFYPCYGLAEATLLVSAGPNERRSGIEGDLVAPGQVKKKIRVGCGRPLPSERVAIVDPESSIQLGAETVGEIWVSGPNVAQGYWNRDLETERTFGAYLRDTGEGPFLRTGDLGYIGDGELFVVGRIKDLIIIRGRNHYPQDIESTVQQSDQRLESGAGAAFSVERADEEQLVIVKELSQRIEDPNSMIETIQEAVAREHEVQAHAIVLVEKGSLPKTTSGKIQRRECRNLYLAGDLATVVEWRGSLPSESEPATSTPAYRLLTIDAIAIEAIEQSILSFLAAKLGPRTAQIKIDEPLLSYGIDSLTAIELSHHLESRFGVVIPLESLFESTTIAQLARQLLDRLRGASGHSRPAITPCQRGRTEHPLSYGQRSLWFLHRLAPYSGAYNVSAAVRIRSNLDVGALRRALQKIVNRHDSLRTAFHSRAGELFQRVHRKLEITLLEMDASSWSDEALDDHLALEAHRPFDLEQGPLLRVSLFARTQQDHVFLVVAHHIVVDLWSMGVLMHELGLCYRAEVDSTDAALAPLNLQYADYVYWQKELLAGQEGERLWSHWQRRLAGEPGAIDLPTDRPRPPHQTFSGGAQPVYLSADLTRALRALGRNHGATLYMTLQAVFHALLRRYTAQEKIVIGSPMAGRSAAELGGVIGYFVNPVVLHADLSGNPAFGALLEQVREMTVTAIAHQDYPFALLVERLRPERDPSRSPLFQALFALQRAPSLGEGSLASQALVEGELLDFGGLSASSRFLRRQAALFDLSLILVETEAGLKGFIEYNTDLFDPPRIGRMAGHFGTLAEAAVADPATRIDQLKLLSAAERDQVLVEFNLTAREYDGEQCAHALFEAQAARTPHSIAVMQGDCHLSYGELNVRANRLARHLRGLGVKPDSRIAICLERSIEMVVAMLAALKAGGAYVPLDPAHPPERLAYMLEDSEPAILFTDGASRGVLAGRSPRARVVDLDTDAPQWAAQSASNPDPAAIGLTARSLAYVIYTSGSTGLPKGVMVEHKGLRNLAFAQTQAFAVGPDSRVLQFASFSFDAYIFELMMTFNRGAMLALPLRGAVMAGQELAQTVDRYGITHATLPPAALATTPQKIGLDSVRLLVVAGEAVTRELVQRWSPGRRMVNAYGPTEATVWATLHDCRVDEPGPPPIGHPIVNTRIYILDSYGQPSPIGLAGDIYIGGAGVARGYLNRRALTDERFLPDPFSQEPGSRMYRTGDLGRWLSGGSIEFLGRSDFQIKIRSFRIEPAEIEATLTSHSGVYEAVVVAHDNGETGRQLAAYYTGETIGAETLRAHLSSRLPEYMVPATYVRLESLPLTPHGKLDRKALPRPGREQRAGQRADAPPRTPVEEILVEIFQKALKLERVGRDDNFFELGGHSLLATQIVSRIRDIFGVEVEIRSVFEQPTVEGLARRVERAIGHEERDETPPLVRISRDWQAAGLPRRLPLSFAQQRLWFIGQLEPGAPLYNIPGVVNLEGRWDVEKLESAINEIIRRHEVLRTRFEAESGEPEQVIDLWEPRKLEVIDLTGLPPGERAEAASRRAREEAGTGFDLSRGPLIRLKVLKLEEEEHILLFTMHHIVSDGWSMEILIREVWALYHAYTTGGAEACSPLEELPIQYADFAAWQRSWLQGEALEREIDYWRKQLAGMEPLALPTDRPRPAARSYCGGSRQFVVDRELARRLRELSWREGATLFMTLLGAFEILLSRYSGQTDVVIGTDIANRNRAEIEGLIGFFVNQLVLRVDVKAMEGFSGLLKKVRDVCLGAYTHQDLPFEKLVEELQPERDLSRSPLFQVKLIWQNAPQARLEFGGARLRIDGGEWLGPVALQTAKFDLTVSITEWAADAGAEERRDLVGSVEYSRDLFEDETIERLVNHYTNVLKEIVREPFHLEGFHGAGERPIAELSLLSDEERRQITEEWNETGRLYSQVRSVGDLFAEQSRQGPERLAIRCGERQISYRELNERANRLARYLREFGVRPEVMVGICLERSIELVIGLLAVLKAGGVYVPMDPIYPDQRLGMMIEDGGIGLLLTQEILEARHPKESVKAISLDREWETISTRSPEDLPAQAAPDNPAYMIYTSGSTGRPKGVMVTHRSVYNLFNAVNERLHFNEEDVWTMFHSPAFDFSVWEIWGALIHGGTLVIAPYPVARASQEFYGLVYEQGVTILSQTPSAFRRFNEVDETAGAVKKSSLRAVIFGGEALEVNRLKSWMDRYGDESPLLINMYGITETTVHTTYKRLTGEDLKESCGSNIGRPLANIRLHVLDERMQPAPVGVVGELYVGGAGVARGYLGREELTAERFLPKPGGSDPGERIYRTGDLGRRLKDGNIEYFGRRDQQVKIRGYRIELGEIERALLQHEAIREAVVIAREDAGDRSLVAYLVSAGSERLAMNELRTYLRQRLPDYMAPSAFVLMEKMPQTPNGKLDRQALPRPSGARGEGEEVYFAPRTPIEEILAGLFEEALKLDRIGIRDNFFEIGGHSLLATQVISRVRNALGVEIGVRSIFEAPTAEGLARRVEEAMRVGEMVEAPPLVRAGREDYGGAGLPLSFAQQRLWFIDQLEPGNATYNISARVKLDGGLGLEALESAITEIVRRHEVLRTRFEVAEGEPVQVIDRWEYQRLEVRDLTSLPPTEREGEVRWIARAEAETGFDLSRGPLLRVRVLRLGEEEHVALFTMHHIVSDAWSIDVLIREIGALYQAYRAEEPSPLEELPIQYADFAVWQRSYLTGGVLQREVEYWKERLRDAHVLDLPTDHPRPATPSFRGGSEMVEVGRDLSEGLRRLGQREGATLFIVLMAAFKTLLMRYSGEEDVVVGTPIANRTRREIEDLIGFFVNTLVLRTDLGGNPSFRELIRRERETALGAYAHQEAPFEKLVEEINPDRDLSRSPLFQVMMALQNRRGAELKIEGVRAREIREEAGGAKFDLTLTLSEGPEGIGGSIVYSRDLYDGETMRRMARHYEKVIAEIVRDSERRIVEIEIISEAEKSQILIEFNRTRREYDGGRLIHELIEAQADKVGDKTAVVDEWERVSYGELNRRANQLAGYLIKRGVGVEDRVGICMDRGIEMIVGLLGILKAGAAYVPLDPTYPRERLEYMLTEAEVKTLVTRESLNDLFIGRREDRIRIDSDWPTIERESVVNPAREMWEWNLAYVIYTSGSTGKPKGTGITHRSAVTLLNWAGEAFSDEELNGVLASTSICFDLSVFELMAPLSSGGKVIVAENALSLPEMKAAEEVKLINTVPSAIRELAGSRGIPDSAETVNLAGEALRNGLAQEVYEVGTVKRVLNLYGPTEDTTYSTWTVVGKGAEEEPSVGRPVANTEVYIVDEEMRPTPIGVYGEIYIGGEGLARCYLNRPEITAEKFAPNPFGSGAGERAYRTGDIGRYRVDGEIEYYGRRDHQVKVRGYRIELGEIERVLEEDAMVREAVVMAREDQGDDKRLVAYIVGEKVRGVKGEAKRLREYLKEKLPEYMRPSAIVELEKMPLTPNGKLDRKALPRPEQERGSGAGVEAAAQTPVEEIVVGIFEEVLKVDQAGRSDNFFEIGGHSLLATQVISRVRERLGAEVGVRSLFEEATAAGLASRIEEVMRAGEKDEAPPLVRAPRGERLPLSFAQQRLWFIDRLEPGSAVYNIPGSVRLEGRLNLEALEDAINEIVRRHEALRTRIEVEEDEPAQVIDEWKPRRLEMEDLSKRPPEERAKDVRRITKAEAETGFDLRRGPLLRIKILKLGEEDHVAIFTMSHIVVDGWSIGILIAELDQLYEAYARGEESPLEELPIQYVDYALWQRAWLQGEALERQLDYWKRQLAGVPSLLRLPTDRPRPAVPTYRGADETFALSQELSGELKRLSRNEGVTSFMSLLAGVQLLLARYSGEGRIAVGTPVAGRTRREIEPLIGLFVNTLVMVTDVSDNPTVKELLQQVRETAIGAFAHQDLHFEKLVEELRPERSLGQQPLFQVMFAFQNHLQRPLALSNLEISEERVEISAANFDLTITVIEDGGRITGLVEYARDLYERATILRFLGHFRRLLEGMTANRDCRVLDLPLLTEQEWEQVLAYNRTAVRYPAKRRIHHLFEEQAERAPDRIAGIDGVEEISYGELNRRANRLGNYLRRRGVGAEVRVGICLERGLEMLVGMLGILKAGGAYVPLDPTHPAGRLRFMLEDAEVRMIVTQEKLRRLLGATQAEPICLDSDHGEIARESEENVDGGVSGENLAYVIYTSGSTGLPKGAMITHDSIVNLVSDAVGKFRLNQESRFLQFASLSFDVVVEEIYPAWLAGGCVVLRPDDASYSYSELTEAIERHGVTTLELPTVYWREWMRELSRDGARAPRCLDLVITGDERISPEVFREWKEHEISLLHVYGVTEAAVNSMVYLAPAEPGEGESFAAIPIGSPIANTEIYLFDGRLQPAPLNISGEIYLGGAGLARGYLNRPELTAERFVPGPFGTRPGSRLYRTGDLAKSLPDRGVEFVSRIDLQVKIRGHRIEPAEIESVLMQAPPVRECVVIAREDEPGARRLVAYLVLQEAFADTALDLRRFLNQRLPSYLVPSSFVILESLPISPHGKVDRRALPAPGEHDIGAGHKYVAPSTPIEEDVARIFREVLRVEKVGIHDDFFALGGHSLLVTQVIGRVNRAFRVELSIQTLFEAPTVSGLITAIVESQAGQAEDDLLSQMLAELDGLSEDEVAALNGWSGGHSAGTHRF